MGGQSKEEKRPVLMKKTVWLDLLLLEAVKDFANREELNFTQAVRYLLERSLATVFNERVKKELKAFNKERR